MDLSDESFYSDGEIDICEPVGFHENFFEKVSAFFDLNIFLFKGVLLKIQADVITEFVNNFFVENFSEFFLLFFSTILFVENVENIKLFFEIFIGHG